LRQLKYCHNLVAQVKPDEEMNIEYGSDEAILIARFIQDIIINVNKWSILCPTIHVTKGTEGIRK
jgi:hypothetical protein